MEKHFFDYYKVVNSSEKFENKYISNPQGKECRFCGGKFSEVTFANRAHIIPELFGRNNLISNFECDACNSKYQKFESDASTMVAHHLSLLSVATKKGIPVFQSAKSGRDRSTTLKMVNGLRSLDFDANIDDFEIDEDAGSMTVKFRTRKYSPFSVFKVLLKVGVSLLDKNELQPNRHFLDILNLDEPLLNGLHTYQAFRTILNTKYYRAPKAQLFKAKSIIQKNSLFPEYCLVICFANVVLQFFLPLSVINIQNHNTNLELRHEMIPMFALDGMENLRKIEIGIFDLAETKKVSHTDKITLFYKDLVTLG